MSIQLSRDYRKPSAVRWSWWLLLLLAAALPFLGIAVIKTETASSSVHPWFPETGIERETFREFEAVFGAEDVWVLVFSEPVEDSVRAGFINKLKEQNDTFDDPLLRSIRDTNGLLESVSETERRRLKSALRGVFFDQSGTLPVIMAQSTEAGFRNRTAVFEDIIQNAIAACSVEEVVKIAGPGYVGVMADYEARETLLKITPLTFLVASVLCWFMLRSVPLTIIAMTAAGLASCVSMAVVYYGGESLSHLLVVIPSLALLLSLSTAIHLLQYYREAVFSGDGDASWITAFRDGWLATTIAALTTAVGFLALQLSLLPVVETFSVFGAISVLLTPMVVFAVVFIGLVLLKPKPFHRDWVQDSCIALLTRVRGRRANWTLAFLLLLLVVSIAGLPRLKTEVRMETFFAEQSEFGQNHQWFENEFGFYHFLQVVGRFESDISLADQWSAIDSVHQSLEEQNSEFTIFSAATFSDLGKSLTSSRGSQEALSFLESENLISVGDGENHWRLSVYYSPESGEGLREIEKRISDALSVSSSDEVSWDITGAYKLFGAAQERLLSDLLRTFYFACLLILPLIALTLRSLQLGILALVGNLFPISLLFGGMGILGLPLDISTMVIGSIAFGVAVDDTMHFMTCLSRARKQGNSDMDAAINQAYRKSGAAIIKTTLILSIGLTVFLLSDFVPSRRFAIYTSVVIMLAALGDLLLIPLLMRGPFRRFVKPHGRVIS